MTTPQADIYGNRIRHAGVRRGAKANDASEIKEGAGPSRKPLP